jgi:hypothetical protein
MHPAVQGALVGCGIGLFLVAGEYYFVVKNAKERAKRQHETKYELDPTERKRMRSIASFSAFLPPAFAFFFWLIWA